MEQQTDDNKEQQPADAQNTSMSQKAPEPAVNNVQQNNVEIEKVSEQIKVMEKQLTEKMNNIYSMQRQIKDTNEKGGEPNGETDDIYY